MSTHRVRKHDKPHAGNRPRRIWQVLGPGLITGASDDDPSGIATYSQVSAQFGTSMGWVMLFSYPLMTIAMLMDRNKKVMGEFTLPLSLTIVGWLATAVMAIVVIVMFATWNS